MEFSDQGLPASMFCFVNINFTTYVVTQILTYVLGYSACKRCSEHDSNVAMTLRPSSRSDVYTFRCEIDMHVIRNIMT